MSTTNIILIVVFAVLLALYLGRRRGRISRED